jgi:hypothetical protein
MHDEHDYTLLCPETADARFGSCLLAALDCAGTYQSQMRCALMKSMQDAERMESGKAAVIAAAGGLAGTLPSVLSSTMAPAEQALSALTGAATCFLFGVVYRYVAAGDPGNPQLRGGAVAAFGLTRGLALAQPVVARSAFPDGEALASGALLVGQSMLAVAFAAAALEAAAKAGFVRPFGQAEDASSE